MIADNVPRPQDRDSRIAVLQTAHKLWEARSSTSEDAKHATRVLKAILNRVESPSASSNGETLVGSPHHQEAPATHTPTGQPTWHHEASASFFDHPEEFTGDAHWQLPLESFYTNTEVLDWVGFPHHKEQSVPWMMANENEGFDR